MIVAIDGPAASGKGTLARKLADHYGLPHLDTGKLYRFIAKRVLAQNLDIENAGPIVALVSEIDPAALKDTSLGAEEVGRTASMISSIPELRAALLHFQRAFAEQPEGALLDGRDIGSVICPDADVKFFIEADAGVRAERRYREEIAHNVDACFETILDDIKQRDERDRARAISPLVAASDAYLLDTTKLSIEAVFRSAVDIIEKFHSSK